MLTDSPVAKANTPGKTVKYTLVNSKMVSNMVKVGGAVPRARAATATKVHTAMIKRMATASINGQAETSIKANM